MKNFYKIENDKLQVGSGFVIPDGFIEYDIGKEPVDFIETQLKEIEIENLQNKIQEANSYLIQTDWVNTYKIRHDLGLELIPEDSSKWLVINKRQEYIIFLKGVN